MPPAQPFMRITRKRLPAPKDTIIAVISITFPIFFKKLMETLSSNDPSSTDVEWQCYKSSSMVRAIEHIPLVAIAGLNCKVDDIDINLFAVNEKEKYVYRLGAMPWSYALCLQ